MIVNTLPSSPTHPTPKPNNPFPTYTPPHRRGVPSPIKIHNAQFYTPSNAQPSSTNAHAGIISFNSQPQIITYTSKRPHTNTIGLYSHDLVPISESEEAGQDGYDCGYLNLGAESPYSGSASPSLSSMGNAEPSSSLGNPKQVEGEGDHAKSSRGEISHHTRHQQQDEQQSERQPQHFQSPSARHNLTLSSRKRANTVPGPRQLQRKKSEADRDCGICFEYAVRPCRTLCCGKIFCEEHLDDWLHGPNASGLCPNCDSPCALEDTLSLATPPLLPSPGTGGELRRPTEQKSSTRRRNFQSQHLAVPQQYERLLSQQHRPTSPLSTSGPITSYLSPHSQVSNRQSPHGSPHSRRPNRGALDVHVALPKEDRTTTVVLRDGDPSSVSVSHSPIKRRHSISTPTSRHVDPAGGREGRRVVERTTTVTTVTTTSMREIGFLADSSSASGDFEPIPDDTYHDLKYDDPTHVISKDSCNRSVSPLLGTAQEDGEETSTPTATTSRILEFDSYSKARVWSAAGSMSNPNPNGDVYGSLRHLASLLVFLVLVYVVSGRG